MKNNAESRSHCIKGVFYFMTGPIDLLGLDEQADNRTAHFQCSRRSGHLNYFIYTQQTKIYDGWNGQRKETLYFSFLEISDEVFLDLFSTACMGWNASMPYPTLFSFLVLFSCLSPWGQFRCYLVGVRSCGVLYIPRSSFLVVDTQEGGIGISRRDGSQDG